ncbi:MarR family winged helix-turn-helix transcriptional regulator [Paraclostridium bifermentans]|uniref:MarR family winged helix-turn-helix transcriptional regulator n=1 Tax=Paraclostridium bifermentans TaxID=1490 RepID=UPI0018AAEA19|nr:MarR family transcriptional regulator [Paraclostridium bifermentans]
MMEKKAYIFGAIFFLSNRIQNEGDKVFSEITTKQWFLLISIIRSGVNSPTLTEVSKIIGYSRQNVKKLSINLEKAGFVELQKDVNDSRVLRISLTDSCYQYFKNRQEKEESFIERLYDGITEEELDSMLLVMKKLEKNIGSFE